MFLLGDGGGALCFPGQKKNMFKGRKSAKTNQFSAYSLRFLPIRSILQLLMLYLGYLSVQATVAITINFIL